MVAVVLVGEVAGAERIQIQAYRPEFSLRGAHTVEGENWLSYVVLEPYICAVDTLTQHTK